MLAYAYISHGKFEFIDGNSKAQALPMVIDFADACLSLRRLGDL